MMTQRPLRLLTAGVLGFGLVLQGCGGDDGNLDIGDVNGGDISVPENYEFESRFGTESSVSYSGQITRHVLIHGLNAEIAGFDDRISSGDLQGDESDIVAIMNSFYEDGTAALAEEPFALTTEPETRQTTYGDISTGKNLVGKTAGNDDVTDHRDWDGGDFGGWNNVASPQVLIQEWFQVIAENAVEQRDSGSQRVDPINGDPIKVYHTEDGLDLKQLVQKFLLGAVAFSQGADDYLDDDVAGKGLLSDNLEQDGDAPYTGLEHQWDEGFGYFGAARNYNDYTDEEIAGKGGREGWENGYHDTDGDGRIDLNAEYNFGNSQNAGKRDLGSTTGTDFSTAAFDAFLTGRAIITEAGGELSDEELDDLREQRDIALLNWEKSIAATVVHYINDTLADMEAFGTDGYNYVDHTKHWGELKGFALGLQFNPRSAVSDSDFQSFHDKVGVRPVLPNDSQDNIDAYEQALLEARDILQAAYDFEQDDVENW